MPRPAFTLVKHWHKQPVPTVPKTLGDFLKCVRLQRKMSLKQVAAIIGVSHEAVNFWEGNCYEPTEERRARVVEFIGFDPELNKQRDEGKQQPT